MWLRHKGSTAVVFEQDSNHLLPLRTWDMFSDSLC